MKNIKTFEQYTQEWQRSEPYKPVYAADLEKKDDDNENNSEPETEEEVPNQKKDKGFPEQNK